MVYTTPPPRPDRSRLRRWLRSLTSLFSATDRERHPAADEYTTPLVIVKSDSLLIKLLLCLPGWEDITREEAAQVILERDVKIRYSPAIIEMDRDTTPASYTKEE